MKITVLRETGAGEARVALMPDSVQKLVALQASVMIESAAWGYSDALCDYPLLLRG